MFTGIIEEVGQVVALDRGPDCAVLTVRGPLVTSDATHGSSIVVNGTCLTVTELHDGTFSVDVMAETLDRTCLGGLRSGDPVNLERALSADGRFGGHIVQGHVDGVARLLSRTPGSRWEVFRFTLPEAVGRYVVEKGSVAVDGTSLTVSAVGRDWFEVSLIPTTLTATVLGTLAPGDQVNIEVDVLAKYVESLLEKREQTC